VTSSIVEQSQLCYGTVDKKQLIGTQNFLSTNLIFKLLGFVKIPLKLLACHNMLWRGPSQPSFSQHICTAYWHWFSLPRDARQQLHTQQATDGQKGSDRLKTHSIL